MPTSRDLAGDEALAELTRRYFAAHAPATVHDFAWWSGLSISKCRRGVQLLGAEIASHRWDDVAFVALRASHCHAQIPPRARPYICSPTTMNSSSDIATAARSPIDSPTSGS